MNIDRRILYWTLVIIVIIPLLNPLGLPIPISKTTKASYDAIDSLPAGSVVMYGVDQTVARIPELGPGDVAIFKHLMENDLKVLVYTLQADGAGPINYMLENSANKLEGKVYGEDYAVFGYVPGEETAVASLASDIKATFGTDTYGTSTDELKILEGVDDASDIDLVISATGSGYVQYYIRHWHLDFDVPIVMSVISFSYPDVNVQYNAGLIAGILNGQRGGAEYEVLIRAPAIGARLLDAQSAAHLLLIAYIVLGNIGFLMTRSRRES